MSRRPAAGRVAQSPVPYKALQFCFVYDSDLSPKGFVLKADHWVLASPVEPTALASGHTYSNDRPIHSEDFILPGKSKSCNCKEFGLRGQGPYPPYAVAWLQGFYKIVYMEI